VGTGSGQDANPRPGQVVTEGRFARIVAMDRTSCGITQGGLADCWGTNPGSVTQNVDDVVGTLHWASLAGAHEHICGATQDGQGFCTGREQFGELGNLGTHQNQGTTPGALAPLHLVDQPPVAGMECNTGGYAEAVCSARVDHLGRRFSTYSWDDFGVERRIWSWGDGSPEEEGEWVRHGYRENGTYVITLTVVDAAGQRSMKQATVWVTNYP
jgi:PKD domain